MNKYNEDNIKKQKVLIEAQRAKDQADRAAFAKSMELQAAKDRLAGTAVLPNGVIPSVLGRKDDKKGGKRGREGEGVSTLLESGGV